MKYVYNFVGGKLNKKMMEREEVDKIAYGYSDDMSELRAKGRMVYRAELDNQPLVEGYLSPMWDGLRYNGKYAFEATEEDKKCEPVAVIRYETQEVYSMLSR